MAIKTESFGQTSKGEQVTLYKISNSSGMTVGVIDFGANIVSILVPDRDGKFDDFFHQMVFSGFPTALMI